MNDRTPPQPDRVPINDPTDPRVAVFRDLKDATLKDREHLFLAEGRLVVPILLGPDSRFAPAAILGTLTALDATDLAAVPASCPVYQATQTVMDTIAGFHIHRGLIAAGRREPVPQSSALLAPEGPALAVACEHLTNHDNLGGIFRNAAAFAAHAVLVSPRCCDPLYRKAIRVSMGHALRVPFAHWPAGRAGIEQLHELGQTTLALDPAPDAPPIEQALARIPTDARLTLVVGSEGPGLTRGASTHARVRARITMSHATDSLNTATATGIALHAAARRLELLDR